MQKNNSKHKHAKITALVVMMVMMIAVMVVTYARKDEETKE